jgi:uncharacterized membrane protein
MKLSLFCLGNTAAAVMVGSAGTALESCNKAEAESREIRSRANIFAAVVTFRHWSQRDRNAMAKGLSLSVK